MPLPHGSVPSSPGVFNEALHTLYIALHPQTQHRATYSSRTVLWSNLRLLSTRRSRAATYALIKW